MQSDSSEQSESPFKTDFCLSSAPRQTSTGQSIEHTRLFISSSFSSEVTITILSVHFAFAKASMLYRIVCLPFILYRILSIHCILLALPAAAIITLAPIFLFLYFFFSLAKFAIIFLVPTLSKLTSIRVSFAIGVIATTSPSPNTLCTTVSPTL